MTTSAASATSAKSFIDFSPSQYSRICDFIALIFLFLAAIAIDISTAGLEICCYGALLFFLIGGAYRQKWDFIRTSPLILTTLLLYGVVILWSLHSPAPWKDINGSLTAYAKLLLIPFGLWAFQRYPKSIIPFLTLLSSALFLVFLISTLKVDHFLPIAFTAWLGGDQLTSLNFGHFNGASHIALSYFAAVLAFSWGWIFFQKFSSLNLWQKFGCFLLSAFSFYYLLFVSDGRSGLPALVIPVAYLCFRAVISFRKWKHSATIFIVFLAALSLAYHFSSTLNHAIAHGTSDLQQYQAGNEGTSWGERLGFWKNAAHLIEAHPFLGHGTGAYPAAYQILNTPPLLSNNPHQQYLFFWVENGLVGFLVFIVFLYLASAHGMISSQASKIQKTLGILLEANIIAFAVGCLYNSWLHDVHEGFFFILSLSGLYSLASRFNHHSTSIQ
jgi:O-antigen ligase